MSSLTSSRPSVMFGHTETDAAAVDLPAEGPGPAGASADPRPAETTVSAGPTAAGAVATAATRAGTTLPSRPTVNSRSAGCALLPGAPMRTAGAKASRTLTTAPT